MRIAVHAAHNPERPIAETEVYRRMAIAVARLGWTCCRTDNTRQIDEFAPDLVLAEHFFVPKLTAYPTLGIMWNPLGFWKDREIHLKNVISYDGHLFADKPTRQLVRDLVSPLTTRFVEGAWFPTCQATDLVHGERNGVAYFFTGWDKGRHATLLPRLEKTARVHRYGSGGGATLPFDGSSALKALTKHAAALCFHSEAHRKAGMPSARVFEAAASGAIIISDGNDFVRETFGDAALYVDTGAPPPQVADQVSSHLAWIEKNPQRADEVRAEAHRIFSERFTFEKLLGQFPELLVETRRLWRTPEIINQSSVAYVIRSGNDNPALLSRTLTALEEQTHSNLQAIVVAHRNASPIKHYLQSRRPGNVKVSVIEVGDPAPRSTALWAGLSGIAADFYGLLEEGDALLPNHVSACLATLNANPDADLVYGGVIEVAELDNGNEPRSIGWFSHVAPDALRQPHDLLPNTWLARRATLDRIGADPQLNMCEDYYLLLHLNRGANFAPTWRLTTEHRSRAREEAHRMSSRELAESVDRIKHRLYFSRHAPFAKSNEVDALRLLQENRFIAGRILKDSIEQRLLRKGLQAYLSEVVQLPRRVMRLPALLAAEGLKGVVKRIRNRGAAEYARRAGDQLVNPNL